MQDKITELITSGYNRSFSVKSTEKGYSIRLPFWDTMGDPIDLFVVVTGDNFRVTDNGIVAGLLFSSDQDEEDSSGFKLVMALQKAHGFIVDFDDGLLYFDCISSNFFDVVMEMSEIVITIVNVVDYLPKLA